jgi:3-hydroxyisobutyrate dehydrogenase-like beta-hydroxyacid dehydrogenase
MTSTTVATSPGAGRPTVGFIGLGLMGQGFVKRLRKCGYPVVGYDIVPGKIDAIVPFGVQPGASPADVARRCDIVQVCVTTTDAVAEIVRGPQGLLSVAAAGPAGALAGKVLVDHSTTEIGTTRTLASELAAATGMPWVDAPVSGGPEAAGTGTLAIMAGGEAAAIERIMPVMAQLGRFTHMGDVGAGQATKLVNQTLVLTNFCVMAEALRLAQSYGVDATRIPQALASGYAGSNLLPVLFERMIAEDFAPRGFARQVLKDLEMLQAAAREQHLAMPMASQALTLFRLLVAQGKSELDGAAVVTLYPQP